MGASALCLLLLFGTICTFDLFRQKTIKIDRFLGRCPDHKDAPMYLTNIQLSQHNRVYYMSTKIVSTESLANPLRLELILKRCDTKESLDTCENYQDIHVNRLCDLLNANSKPWSPFVKNVQPPLGCPVQKAVHVSTNGSFDGSALTRLPIEGFYWKVQAKIIEEQTNRLILCVYVEGQIVPV